MGASVKTFVWLCGEYRIGDVSRTLTGCDQTLPFLRNILFIMLILFRSHNFYSVSGTIHQSDGKVSWVNMCEYSIHMLEAYMHWKSTIEKFGSRLCRRTRTILCVRNCLCFCLNHNVSNSHFKADNDLLLIHWNLCSIICSSWDN